MRSTLTRRPRIWGRFFAWLCGCGVFLGLYAASWVWLLQYMND